MISIIVPVLNEEKALDASLKALAQLEGDKEIIVVDGGSQDRSREIGRRYGKLVEGPRGRARQMNYGASLAKGDIVWFVHADSRPAPTSLKDIEKAIGAGYIGGRFKLYFYDYKSFVLSYIAFTSNLRRWVLKLIFGDQAIFVRKDIFDGLGGYKDIELMEDFDFSLRLHKAGRVKKLRTKIGSSARRFKEGGSLRVFLHMQKIKYLYLRGEDPEKLKEIYREVR